MISLAGAAGERSPTDFDDFYRVTFPRMVDIARGLSGSRLAAEDLAQDALVAAYRQWPKVGGLDNPGAWVRRVVINKSVSRYRRHLAEAKALVRLRPIRGASPEPLPDDAEEFWRAVRQLSRRQAQAITLHYLEDLPLGEIAEIMEISPNTVKVHLHRGRTTLAELLEEAR
ncbi:MAG: sigma-70 family RNA polymerase sigma factor [Acidimicrobiia bacterium]|nr:sigma-70 family RNA polymerase sigma factor [Acidimicrobiia bacterium]